MRRLAAALVVMALALVMCAGPANAIDGPGGDFFNPENPQDKSCEISAPGSPDKGVSAWLTPVPKAPPKAEDWSADDAQTSLFEQHGLAWVTWPDCANQLDVGARVGTIAGNWSLGLVTIGVGLYASIATVASDPDSWIGWMQPVLTRIVDALREGLTEPTLVIVLLVAGCWLIWRSRQWEISKAVGVLAMVVVVGAGIGLLVADPFRWVSDGARTTVGAAGAVSDELSDGAGSGTTAAPGINQVVDVVLYQRWLQGMFGDSDSATAKEYGPKLLAAATLNWEEAAEIEADPKKAKGIVEDHREEWQKLTGEIKDEDPIAYEFVIGANSSDRFWSGGLAVVAFLCVMPMLLAAAITAVALVLYLFYGLLWILGVAPAWIIPHETAAKYAREPFKVILGAAVATVVLGVVAAVELFVLSVLFAPGTGVPWWLALALMGIGTLIAWKKSKPMRAIATSVTSAAVKGTKLGSKAAVAAATGGAGLVADEMARLKKHDAERREREAAGQEGPSGSATVELAGIREANEEPEAEVDNRGYDVIEGEWYEMEAEIWAAKERLRPKPKEQDYTYQPAPGAVPLPSGQVTWQPEGTQPYYGTPDREPGKSEPTGWPRPNVEPAPGERQPTGWPGAPEAPVHEQEFEDRRFDDGSGPPSIWTPLGGEREMPATGYVPGPGEPPLIRTEAFGRPISELLESDQRFFAYRDSGYAGPLDQDGRPNEENAEIFAALDAASRRTADSHELAAVQAEPVVRTLDLPSEGDSGTGWPR